MTLAKYSHGPEKTAIVRRSFEAKIARLREVYSKWKKVGKRGSDFWPETLLALRAWDEPELGIFRWSSKSIDKISGSNRDLVEIFWQLQEKVKLIPANGDESTEVQRLKIENSKLATQNSALLFEIMDYRDEIVRIDPKNSFLKTTPFPPKLPF